VSKHEIFNATVFEIIGRVAGMVRILERVLRDPPGAEVKFLSGDCKDKALFKHVWRPRLVQIRML